MAIAIMTRDLDLLLEVSRGIREILPQAEILPVINHQEALIERLLQDGRLELVIGAFISDTWLDSLDQRGCPFIDITADSHICSAYSYSVDHDAVGLQAATFLANRGVRGVFCLQTATHYGQRCIAQAFERAAGAMGLTSQAWDESLLPADEGPYGLFCTSDHLARQVEESIGRELCPERLLILSVDNHLQENLLALIPITTIPLPYAVIGRAIAGDYMTHSIHNQRFAPQPIIVRESTSPGHDLVDRALLYIDKHLDSPPSITTLAGVLTVSRRTLENHFSAKLGASPASIWRERQILHAQSLLRTTSHTLDVIALCCGFTGASHLSQAFKRRSLGAPGRYRCAK